VDANVLPVQLGLTPGEAHDNLLCHHEGHSGAFSQLRIKLTSYGSLGESLGNPLIEDRPYLAFIKPAAMRIWRRAYESAPLDVPGCLTLAAFAKEAIRSRSAFFNCKWT
jgi:hypothetical protein